MLKYIISLHFGMAAILTLAGCSTSQFKKSNISSFEEFTLKNGINVIVKKTFHNRINALSVALKGGDSNVPRKLTGIEKMTLNLATYESSKYSNIQKREIMLETASGISSFVNLDNSTYSLKTIDKYFDRSFDLFADLFINPTFSPKYFQEVKTNMINNYRKNLKDGYSRVSLAINREYLKGHPYEAAIDNIESFKRLELEDVKKYYRKNMVASRIFIVAVGNYKVDELKSKLEATFGKLPKGEYAPKKLPSIVDKKEIPLILDSAAYLNKDVSFVRCNFKGPDIQSSDYWPTVLAFRLLKDILGDTIRTKRGMVYSMFAYSLGKKSNYSQIGAYRTSNPIQIMDLINDSINVLASGKCLAPNVSSSAAGKGAVGGKKINVAPQNAEYVDIKEVLDFYKASYETSYYQGIEENLRIAGKMVGSKIRTGDYKEYLNTIQKIDSITSIDIVRATKNFIQDPSKFCAISANPEVISELEKNHSSYGSDFIKVNFKE